MAAIGEQTEVSVESWWQDRGADIWNCDDVAAKAKSFAPRGGDQPSPSAFGQDLYRAPGNDIPAIRMVFDGMIKPEVRIPFGHISGALTLVYSLFNQVLGDPSMVPMV